MVQLAFEAVHHVHHVLEAGALERLARLDGAVAAAADEHDGTLLEVRARELLHLAHEVGVLLPLGAVVPGDHHGADGMADEHVLHLAAAVDEHRVGVRLEVRVRLFGGQVFHDEWGQSRSEWGPPDMRLS